MTFGDRKPLHGWKLMASGGVGDLKRADVLIAADDLGQIEAEVSYLLFK